MKQFLDRLLRDLSFQLASETDLVIPAVIIRCISVSNAYMLHLHVYHTFWLHYHLLPVDTYHVLCLDPEADVHEEKPIQP